MGICGRDSSLIVKFARRVTLQHRSICIHTTISVYTCRRVFVVFSELVSTKRFITEIPEVRLFALVDWSALAVRPQNLRRAEFQTLQTN